MESTLKRYLPATWAVELEATPGKNGPDALLKLRSPDGAELALLVEAKTGLNPRDVSAVSAQLNRRGPESQLLVAPFLSARAREALTEQGMNYLDMTGNIWFMIERPAVFIRDRGLDSDPWREERSIRSLKGPTTSRVVRALCDFRPPYGVRELAQKSGTAQASVSRVLTFLEPEGFVTRDTRGRVTDVDWSALIERWTDDYSLMKSNTPYVLIEPRGIPAIVEKLRGLTGHGDRYAVTGSLAANQIAAYAPTRQVVLYVENSAAATEKLELRPSESGANVLLLEPYDLAVFDRTWQRSGTVFAALSQVAADLLTGSGRSTSEGRELISWMRENEDEWRS